MKVLEINCDSGCGSTGRIASDIARMLEKQGNEVYIAYGRDMVETGANNIKVGSRWDVYSHVLYTRLFDACGFGSQNATKKFVEWIKVFNPDVIHLHNLHGYYLNIRCLFEYIKASNKRIIWTLHDCWPFTGHCSYFDYIKCNKWKTKCEKCQLKQEYPRSILCDNSTRNYYAKKELFCGLENMTIVTPSKWLADIVKQSFLGGYPIEIIPNGIDLSAFKPIPNSFKKRFGIENKIIVLGVAGQWGKRKGFEDFILLSHMLDARFKLVMVGITEEQKAILPGNILGICKTNNVSELTEIYSAADIFLNTTYEDNYPTTNLEAQACGTPVITYRTGGSIESCDEKLIVEQGDIKSIVKILEKGDYLYFSNIDFSKEEMLRRYSILYNEL